MESLVQDVRLGIRLLRKQPGFTFLAITTLALGIGASVALFSVLDAAFIRPLPYPDPEQLVQIYVEERGRDGEPNLYSPSAGDVADWAAHVRVFSQVAVSRNDFVRPLVLDGDEPIRLLAERASQDYFRMYGVTPRAGRDFTGDEYARVAEDVVIIGHDFWRGRFGGDPEVIGSLIRLDGSPATIVGVLPQSFYPKTKLWRPFDIKRDTFADMRGSGADVEGRLRGGLSLAEAESMLTGILERAAAVRGGRKGRVVLRSMYESVTASNVKAARIVAYGVALVVLLACVNVAGLQLARGTTRRPEMAVRASLGAGRLRLLRQLMTESVLLGLCGAVAGVLLAWWSIDALAANIPMSLPSNAPVTINVQAIVFALAAAFVTTLLFGLLPAWRVSRASVTDTLARAGRSQSSVLSRRGGQTLIALEVALAVVLMAGAGLTLRSFARVLDVDLGFDPDRALAIDASPALATLETQRQFYPAVLQNLVAHPGIEAVGAVDNVPLIRGNSYTGARANGKSHSVATRLYLGAYFEAIGCTLKSGAFPSPTAPGPGLPPAVISETAAREMFGTASPIGHVIEVRKVTYQIVAVSGNVRFRGPLSTRPLDSEVFMPAWTSQSTRPRPLTIIARPRRDTSVPHEVLRQAVHSTGQRAVLQEILPGSDWLDDSIVTPRRRAVLLGLLGGLGLVLALVGIFGVTAYAVGRRTQEIGLRMAFGATPRRVVRAAVSDSVWPVAIGLAAGLIGSWWTTRVIESFLFETEPRDMTTFAAVAVTLAAAAVVAAWIPARRAARVDPIVALRAE